jgi:hypothetical protein
MVAIASLIANPAPGVVAAHPLAGAVARDAAGPAATSSALVVVRRSAPPRTEIRDAAGTLLAELTDGARTVSLAGPGRRWGEPGLSTTVTTQRWVRLLPMPFDGAFDAADAAWLAMALADRSPDVLAIAFQYTTGAPDAWRDGVRIAGDARYGPSAGADFNDYLGAAWQYGTSVDRPEPAELGALDCSGFVRMVLGYRSGLRMSIGIASGTLPRRAADQLAGGPGRVVVSNAGRQVIGMATLRPGDLVFFDASSRDGSAIDHVGIYVGVDAGGHHRFVSSRQTIDGPTIGDVGGASVLDGSGYWATAFRATRRP